MDKDAVKKGFTESFNTYRTEAVVQQKIARRLAQMLDTNLQMEPKQAVEVGCGSGFLTEKLLARHPNAVWMHNDIAPSAKGYVEAIVLQEQVRTSSFVIGDAEAMEFPKAIDLFASSSAVQWFADIDAFLSRLSDSMSEQGVVAISTFGPNNLVEVRQLTGSGLSYYSFAEFAEVFGKYFDIVEMYEEESVVHFVEPIEVLRHIKQTGVNGAFRQRWNKGRLADFTNGYGQFRTTKGYSLTYHPIYAVGRVRKQNVVIGQL
jgi:malonyl-CoA O-methyltransferase